MTKLSMSEEEMLKRKYTRPYEKRIADLEQKLEHTEKDLADYQFNYPKIKKLEEENNKLLDVINNQDVKIADLEKENAELKEKYVKNICDCDICDTYCNSLLTKAKEIISKLLTRLHERTITGLNCEECKQAEQFINDNKIICEKNTGKFFGTVS